MYQQMWAPAEIFLYNTLCVCDEEVAVSEGRYKQIWYLERVGHSEFGNMFHEVLEFLGNSRFTYQTGSGRIILKCM
jgi:hypothetical protein